MRWGGWNKDERGASRDEMAAALVEVADGRVPKDRIALRELYAEMIQWPFVGSNEDASPSTSSPGPSPYEAITKTGAEGVPNFSDDGFEPSIDVLFLSMLQRPDRARCDPIFTCLLTVCKLQEQVHQRQVGGQLKLDQR